MDIVIYLFTFVWTVAYILFIIYLYKENSKPYPSAFTEPTYSKVPSPLNPSELSMLLYKKITPSVFTSSILFLEKKGIISVEKNKEDYVFLRLGYGTMSPSQKDVMQLLFDEIGNGDAVTLTQINHYCDKQHGASLFLSQYQMWRKNAYREIKYDFYEQKQGYMTMKLFRNLGLLLMLLNFITKIHFIPVYLLIIPIYFLRFYFYKIYKRTQSATTEYYKWLGFKRFLVDKETYTEEEIPYACVYGPILGIAHELDKKVGNEDAFLLKLDAVVTKSVRNASLKGERSLPLPWKLK